MKSTGMVRKIDELGRLVLPAEIRASLGLQAKDAIEIYTENDRIVLKKYLPGCIFCGSMEGIKIFADQRICSECLNKLKNEY